MKIDESYAHDAYTKFLKQHGWNVKEHHHLDTAWEATFEHGQGGRVIGVNSEVLFTCDLCTFIVKISIPLDGRP